MVEVGGAALPVLAVTAVAWGCGTVYAGAACAAGSSCATPGDLDGCMNPCGCEAAVVVEGLGTGGATVMPGASTLCSSAMSFMEASVAFSKGLDVLSSVSKSDTLAKRMMLVCVPRRSTDCKGADDEDDDKCAGVVIGCTRGWAGANVGCSRVDRGSVPADVATFWAVLPDVVASVM